MVAAPQGWEASEGAGKNTKGAGRTFLPAPIRLCCNGGAFTADRPGPKQPLLVVW